MYCFTPLIGVLFTFPSRYWFTIGHVRVFRLGGWSPHVQTGFHVSRPTRVLMFHFRIRSEEHTSELQSLMRISYAVFCLKKKKITLTKQRYNYQLSEHESLLTIHYVSTKI